MPAEINSCQPVTKCILTEYLDFHHKTQIAKLSQAFAVLIYETQSSPRMRPICMYANAPNTTPPCGQ